MATSRFGQWSGLAAVVGGVLWVIVFAIQAASSSAVGSLLVGVAALTRRVLPRWGAIALIVGSLSLLVFVATQGLIVWLGVPYGAAWIAVGYLLFLGRSGRFRTASRVR